MGTLLRFATSEKQPPIMNTFLFFSTLIAFTRAGTVQVAPAGVAAAVVPGAAAFRVRAPAHDSASIVHERLGGNFAYSTAEAHAYADVVPQISTLTHPVAETTHTHIAAEPIFQHIPVHAQVPVTGPVRTHQTVHQPIVHETRTHTVQEVTHAAVHPVGVAHHTVASVHAAPAVAAVHAAPVAAVHSAGIAHGVAHGLPLAHGLNHGVAHGLPLAHGLNHGIAHGAVIA